MTYDLLILPKAEEDIETSYTWYEERRAGLGYDFILNLEAGFEEILRDPYKFKVEYKAVRKHLIKRFPFKIVYIVKDQKVIIIGVLHGKRNPEIIKGRT